MMFMTPSRLPKSLLGPAALLFRRALHGFLVLQQLVEQLQDLIRRHQRGRRGPVHLQDTKAEPLKSPVGRAVSRRLAPQGVKPAHLSGSCVSWASRALIQLKFFQEELFRTFGSATGAGILFPLKASRTEYSSFSPFKEGASTQELLDLRFRGPIGLGLLVVGLGRLLPWLQRLMPCSLASPVMGLSPLLLLLLQIGTSLAPAYNYGGHPESPLTP